ncbi:PIN domain-containing protein [Xanthobacter sp. VTT E-85241]|uniref:type II toxin-antitoxin system VapC family toxin n=1 Tax=Roseixanthobacter finlandensis TaxID=3119922 RepID=UPI0037278767
MTLPRVYLDANVFIAALEHVGAHSDHAWWILRAIEAEEIIGVTSEITLAEILVKPLEAEATTVVEAYTDMITPAAGFEVLEVGRALLISAAALRAARRSIRLPDAIHLATALAARCSHFVTADERLHVPDGLTRLAITPFTIDDILRPA